MNQAMKRLPQFARMMGSEGGLLIQNPGISDIGHFSFRFEARPAITIAMTAFCTCSRSSASSKYSE